MLPDFPTVKKKIGDDFNKKIREKINTEPFLSKIGRKRVHEGNILTSSSIEGYTESREYKRISSDFSISPDEIIEKGVDAFFSQIDKISEELIKQQSQMFFKKMEEVTERTENIVNAKGKFSLEVYLEALEKVTIDFDEFGNPLLPSLILNPKDLEKIKDEIPKWNVDPNLWKTCLELLVEKKRREWRDREGRRKLVD